MMRGSSLSVEHREVLITDMTSALANKLIVASKATDTSRSVGHRGVAFDVLRLCKVFRDNMASVQGQTPVTMAKIQQYELAANQLLESIGLRDEGPAEASPTMEIRQRIFTLFVQNYDEIRRVLSYLRWHEDDVDVIAPSLYANRTRHTQQDAVPAAPTAPVVAAPTAPAAPVAAAGLPGASPFQQG